MSRVNPRFAISEISAAGTPELQHGALIDYRPTIHQRPPGQIAGSNPGGPTLVGVDSWKYLRTPVVRRFTESVMCGLSVFGLCVSRTEALKCVHSAGYRNGNPGVTLGRYDSRCYISLLHRILRRTRRISGPEPLSQRWL